MDLTHRQLALFDVIKPYFAQHGTALVLHTPHIPGMLSALEAHMEERLTELMRKLTAVEDGNE